MRVFWARVPAPAPHSLCGRGQFLPSVFPTWEMERPVLRSQALLRG